MKRFALNFMMLTALCSSPLFSQEEKSILETLLKKGLEQINSAIDQKVKPTVFSKQTVQSKDIENHFKNDGVIKIPVVFHVVHNSKKDGEIPDAAFKHLIWKINQGFNKINTNGINPNYRHLVANCKIEFYLPASTENCLPIDPISWHFTNGVFFEVQKSDGPYHLPFDQELKRHGYLDSNKYLNIWLCNLKDEVGYSSYPLETNDRNDGVVLSYKLIDASYFNINSQYWACHEIGHWLGLYHIWGQKNGYLADCSDDDFISDTPKQKNKNTRKDVISQSIERVCGNPNLKSNYENFMDYSESIGMFTKGQKAEMRKNIITLRKGFLNRENCSDQTAVVATKTGIFVDPRDGQEYKWVRVGAQKWMAQNLNFATQFSSCYNEKQENCARYGRLYKHREAQTACPPGWRLPNKSDWDILRRFLGNDQLTMRSEQGWADPQQNGNNKSGLDIVPAGYYNSRGFQEFEGLGRLAKFWLREKGGAWGYSRILNRHNRHLIPHAGSSPINDKLSCRCIQ